MQYRPNTADHPRISHSRLRHALCAFGILSCVLATGCQSSTKKSAGEEGQQRWNQVRASVKFQLARQQYESGLFDDVIKTLNESLTQEGRSAESYVLLAQAHLELADVPAATKTLDAAQQVGLASGELHYLRGVTYELRQRLSEAEQSFANARELDPSNIDFLVAHAECLVELGRTVEAQAILDKQEVTAMDHPRVAALSGHIAARNGDIERAIHSYRMALASDKQSPLIAEELGRLLLRDHRYEEALSVVRPLIDRAEVAESDGALRRIVAKCHLALGDAVSARAVLVGYAHTHPRDSAAQLLLAKSAIALSDWLTALRAVDLAEQNASNLNEVRLVRAAAHWKRGDLSTARADLESLVRAMPEDSEVHCLLAEVYRALGRSEEAIAQFEVASRLDPLSAWASAGLRSIRESSQKDATP